MATFDREHGGYRVFVGGVNPRCGRIDLEREFDRFGPIVDSWVARYFLLHAFLCYLFLTCHLYSEILLGLVSWFLNILKMRIRASER